MGLGNTNQMETDMNFGKLGYFGATGFVALVMIAGGIADVALVPMVVEMMAELQYPLYFIQLVGVWKILGGIAILAPGFDRLKEWAYAGIFFDLTGAFVSHMAAGHAFAESVPPLFFAGLLIVSYVLRP